MKLKISGRGFTLIEFMIVIAILSILVSIAFHPAKTSDVPTRSGIGGPSINAVTVDSSQSRCIDGFRFIQDQAGTRQILDEQGHGVRCN
mgnify:CR=1 FL=1